MLDTMGKMFEKIIDTRLKERIETGNFLSSNQYGFRAKRSTVDAINRATTIADNAVTGRNIAGMLTLDVRNAFNSAP